jgi:hypothetical protein
MNLYARFIRKIKRALFPKNPGKGLGGGVMNNQLSFIIKSFAD